MNALARCALCMLLVALAGPWAALAQATDSPPPQEPDDEQEFEFIARRLLAVTPGIVAIFLLAIFWKKATASGALAAAIGSAAFSVAAKIWWPSLPFIDRVGLAFVLCVALGMLVSRLGGGADHPDAIEYSKIDTSTSTGFNWASVAIVLILTGLYAAWW